VAICVLTFVALGDKMLNLHEVFADTVLHVAYLSTTRKKRLLTESLL